MFSHHPFYPNVYYHYLTPTEACYYDPRLIPQNLPFYPLSHDLPITNYQYNHHNFKTDNNKVYRIKGAKSLQFPNTVEEACNSHITTLMIRNIPNQYKFEDLKHILDDHCFQENMSVVDFKELSKFDFFYLPMDYWKYTIEKKMSNLGYAFVNFTTPFAAFKFFCKFHNFKWNVSENKKICQINVAQYQGKDHLKTIFQQKVFRCKSRDFLPVLYHGGCDGSNRRIKGTIVGNHVEGLPRRRTIGTRAFYA